MSPFLACVAFTSFMVSFVFCSPFCVCSVCRLPLVFTACVAFRLFSRPVSQVLVFVTPSWHLCFVLFTNISVRCTHWGALKRKTAAFFLLFGFFFFFFFKRLLNTPQRYNTNATINYKYVTLHYTMNFNGKVTVQKKKKNTF